MKSVQQPPNTQGMAALQIMNLLEGFNISALGEGTANYYHHIVEAIKVAFADRDGWLTDPAFVDIPLQRLLSKDYADERRSLIGRQALPYEQIEPGLRYGAGAARRAPDGDTCILMQNRGCFFSLDENHPNHLEPGKHTFHTIIPAMLLQDGKPVMAYGTMGGEGQPQTQAALLTRLIDFNYDVQQAIEAPRWLMGRTWGTASSNLWLEASIPDETVRELKLRGHPVGMTARWDGTLGHAQAIRINRDTGFFEGGADPRGDGAAMGF